MTVVLAGCAETGKLTPSAGQESEAPWYGMHLSAPGPRGVELLKQAITQELAPMGVNVIVLEVNYRFEYQSHPELRGRRPMTKEQARDLGRHCKEHGIRLIPQFNCLGHQSRGRRTFELLTKYPQFDETPQVPRNNEGIYCRSWCPLHPDVNRVVFALMDELLDAFEADALHVGMDEVLLIASEQCPRCRGKDRSVLFAKTVNDIHHHLVDQKKVEMMMWGDRLLDIKRFQYDPKSASMNGTWRAIGMIPKDIVICDWHYYLKGRPDEFPSVGFFQEEGFRVWPSSWKDEKAGLALMEYSHKAATPRMMGQLFTAWCSPEDFCRALLNDGNASRRSETAAKSAKTLRACMAAANPPRNGQ
jgi:hypothetical protein